MPWHDKPKTGYIEGPLAIPPPCCPVYTVFTVTQSNDTLPVLGALVCLHKEDSDTFHAVGYTDYNGQVSFNIPLLDPGVINVNASNQLGPICITPDHMQTIVIDTTQGFGERGDPLIETFEWQLKPVSPNPVHSLVLISYSVAGRIGITSSQYVELIVFDAAGRKVCTLFSGKQNPGSYEIVWDLKDSFGAHLSSGVYFVRMLSNNFFANKQVVLLK